MFLVSLPTSFNYNFIIWLCNMCMILGAQLGSAEKPSNIDEPTFHSVVVLLLLLLFARCFRALLNLPLYVVVLLLWTVLIQL